MVVCEVGGARLLDMCGELVFASPEAEMGGVVCGPAVQASVSRRRSRGAARAAAVGTAVLWGGGGKQLGAGATRLGVDA